MMRKKLAYSLVLISMLLAVSTICNPAAAPPNYLLVGVKVGNTADYSTVIGNSTYTTHDNKLHVSVFSINGALVTFNSTYYFSNDTVDSGPAKSFQVNVTTPSLSTLFGWTSLIAANLTAHDPVFLGSTSTINETTWMMVAGVNRTVNHFDIANGMLNVYWDKPTGIMVKLNFDLISVWLNFTMSATNMWSASGLGLSTTTLLIIGGIAAVVIIVAALVLLRRRK